MEVHLYALCWNDADMLPFFFRQYDPIVSRYFLFDDHSSDSSLDLMHTHPNVEVAPLVRSDPDSFAPSELSISNECWETQSWVGGLGHRHRYRRASFSFRSHANPSLKWGSRASQ